MSNSLKKNAGKKKAELNAGIFTDIVSKIAGIYVFLMLAVFPLFTTDLYYNVLKDRFYFFFYATAAAAAVSLIVLLTGFLGGALRRRPDGSSPLREIFRLDPTDLLLLAFLFVAVISTVFSKWPYEAFWGNMGRLQGCFFYLIAAVAFFLVKKFFHFSPRYLHVFLLVGVLMVLWGITDYLGLDIFGWRADANDYYSMLVFTSSAGNVNTYTAIVSLFFGASAVLCLGHRRWPVWLPLFFLFSMGLITGASDNAFLAAAGTLALLPFYAFSDAKKTGRYLLLLAVFALALACTGWLTSVWTTSKVLLEKNWGILLKLANADPKGMLAVSAILLLPAAWCLALSRRTAEFPSRKLRIIWLCLGILAVLAVAVCLIDANFTQRLPLPEELSAYLVFNDRWGTNRGYAWRSSLEFFREFSLWKKLIGSGPETFAIFMAENYYYEMLDFMGTVFDSPHSEPLQYLFTTGILGFISFYGAMASAISAGVRKGGYGMVLAFMLAAYLLASLINISVPISTPLLFLVAAMIGSAEKANEKMG